LVPDIDDMTKEPASVNIKSMYPSFASIELAKITSDYAREYTDGSMIDDIAGFAVYNINYETGHQLTKPSSAFRLKSLQLGWHWSIFKYAFVVNI
jgi:hypothetical protein